MRYESAGGSTVWLTRREFLGLGVYSAVLAFFWSELLNDDGVLLEKPEKIMGWIYMGRRRV